MYIHKQTWAGIQGMSAEQNKRGPGTKEHRQSDLCAAQVWSSLKEGWPHLHCVAAGPYSPLSPPQQSLIFSVVFPLKVSEITWTLLQYLKTMRL